jgi:hypothetical protein
MNIASGSRIAGIVYNCDPSAYPPGVREYATPGMSAGGARVRDPRLEDATPSG